MSKRYKKFNNEAKLIAYLKAIINNADKKNDRRNSPSSSNK